MTGGTLTAGAMTVVICYAMLGGFVLGVYATWTFRDYWKSRKGKEGR